MTFKVMVKMIGKVKFIATFKHGNIKVPVMSSCLGRIIREFSMIITLTLTARGIRT